MGDRAVREWGKYDHLSLCGMMMSVIKDYDHKCLRGTVARSLGTYTVSVVLCVPPCVHRAGHDAVAVPE